MIRFSSFFFLPLRSLFIYFFKYKSASFNKLNKKLEPGKLFYISIAIVKSTQLNTVYVSKNRNSLKKMHVYNPDSLQYQITTQLNQLINQFSIHFLTDKQIDIRCTADSLRKMVLFFLASWFALYR